MKQLIFHLFNLSLIIGSSTAIAMSRVPPHPAPKQCAPVTINNEPTLKQVRSENGRFLDQKNRMVILRGINVPGNSKVPPFTPLNKASMLDPLPGWGFNNLRLIFTWEAFEPERCNYNEAYMQYYEQIVQWAEERDLSVIVDFHQDGFSRWSISGCGEGFPKWAVSSEVKLKWPRNDASCKSWGVKMLLDASHHKTWRHFHSNQNDVRSRFLQMQEYVAARLSRYPNVIGYDLLNEPWGTRKELWILFEDSAKAIRRADPHAMLIVPPHAIASSGIFMTPPIEPSFDNIAYAPHYYNASVVTINTYLGDSPNHSLNYFNRTAERWNTPLILGEFGARPDTKGVKRYISAIYNWLDSGFHSSQHWVYTPGWREDIKDGWNQEDFSIIDDKGQLRDNYQPRPTVVAIAGEPLKFNATETAVSLRWMHQPEQGTTELYLPAGFMEGKQLEVSSDAQCQLKQTKLSCSSSNNAEISLDIHQ